MPPSQPSLFPLRNNYCHKVSDYTKRILLSLLLGLTLMNAGRSPRPIILFVFANYAIDFYEECSIPGSCMDCSCQHSNNVRIPVPRQLTRSSDFSLSYLFMNIFFFIFLIKRKTLLGIISYVVRHTQKQHTNIPPGASRTGF